MPAVPEGPMTATQMERLRTWLRSHLSGQVAVEVWSREESGLYTGERDVNPQGEMALAVMRQVKSAHPAITLTPYDLDAHADSAAERGKDSVLDPAAIAETYYQLHLQQRSAWSHEVDLRPYVEKF